MGRRKYSQEFKREAGQLANDSNVSVSQVARDLGLNDGVLRRLFRETGSQGNSAFQGAGKPRDEELSFLGKEGMLCSERPYG